ncbi:hypothetical protein [Legionella nagasakiensis]|uniref:hypothetical protein n=1 Tax=Legionella nagasakiensis TaxID=535290 RepID=UPI001054AE4A|nr:hypothetical protein [Legionella nagasakiensis]
MHFDNAPRCGGKTKSNEGKPCRCPAVKDKARCRVHGGAKGSGAKQGNSNALKHGYTTTISKNFRKTIRITLNDTAKLIKEFYQK